MVIRYCEWCNKEKCCKYNEKKEIKAELEEIKAEIEKVKLDLCDYPKSVVFTIIDNHINNLK